MTIFLLKILIALSTGAAGRMRARAQPLKATPAGCLGQARAISQLGGAGIWCGHKLAQEASVCIIYLHVSFIIF